MIAIDTSALIAFFEGEAGRDVELVGEALDRGNAVLPPVVLSELLSDPQLPRAVAALLRELPLLEPRSGYWERVGLLRAKVLARRLRARLADALIAQACIDHGVALVTRDGDFRHFARHGGLQIAR